MAKGTRGGRRAGGSGGGGGSALQTGNVATNAVVMTDADAQQLRAQQDSSYDANTTAAVKMYISNTNFDGKGHSMSQAMNYLLDNNADINASAATINAQLGTNFTENDMASMRWANSYMQSAAHPLGRDTMLQRGAHDDLLKNAFNISNYQKYSDSQLQQMLVGKTFQNTSFMSTSYDINKNPFLSSQSGSGVSGGREVVLNIKAGKNTNVVFGARKQSEVVIAKGTDFRVTGVRYTGKTVSPRGGSSKRQIVIDIETY